MILRTLQRRIVVVFVGLLMLVMALIVALVASSNSRIVANETARELVVGTHVFQRLLEQNQRQLETAATVLSSDFAFREAIATQDSATVQSVIRNHGMRIGARVMMVVSPQGDAIADTQQPTAQPRPFPFSDLLGLAQSAGKGSGFRQMKDGILYQIVLVPILAPRLIAWVAMGFQVDDQWARELSASMDLTVSVVRGSGAALSMLASSLDTQRRSVLARALMQPRSDPVLEIGEEHFQTVQVPIGKDVFVVLQRSLEQVQAPFRSLLAALLLTVLGGIGVFAMGSIALARAIVRPLNELSVSARRIEAGDYSQPVPKLPPDEIGQLALSVDHMRERIASREEKILRLAYEDALTGLPNRTRFIEAFEQLPEGASGAVLVLNIERFAMINNALGHSVGDRLLIEIGLRLRQVGPQPRLLARLWGDEFAFLLTDADGASASAFAQSLLETLREPITLEGQRLDVGASLGPRTRATRPRCCGAPTSRWPWPEGGTPASPRPQTPGRSRRTNNCR